MGAQYEGLVVLYNTLAESAGGKILNDDGTKAVMDDGTVQALEQLQKFATSGVTSPSFSNATEDPVRLEFQSGSGAFQVNWPFVYPALQEANPDLAKQVGWARDPRHRRGHPQQGHHRRGQPGGQLATPGTRTWSFEAARCIRSAGAPEVLRHQRRRAADHRGGLRRPGDGRGVPDEGHHPGRAEGPGDPPADARRTRASPP